MGKKSKSQTGASAAAGAVAPMPFLSGKASVDPSLASLFEQSAGPVVVPEVPRLGAAPKPKKTELEDEGEDEASDEENDSAAEDEAMEYVSESPEDTPAEAAQAEPSRKRKRAVADDLESSYMRRLEKEEQKEQKKRREERPSPPQEEKSESDDEASAEEVESEDEEMEIPKHEAAAGEAKNDDDHELAKSSRTVFLGNVSSQTITSKSAKKELMKHLSSFLSDLPESSGPHKVDSIRFRSTAFANGGKLPKRAAFAQKDLHDDTTPSTNAYAIYSTAQAAKKAPAALNGTTVLDRHLRVDNIAHPAKVDHKRCVFVGNLDFIDNETRTEDGEKKKKKRAPADVEEGLWRTFNAHTKGTKSASGKGNVESVRVVRDRSTRVGKGFAYVQFYDQNCVEEALLLNDKQYPPMLPRKLRVVRAKKVAKKIEDNQGPSKGEDRTLHGRAGKLLGRSSAARLKMADKKSISQSSLVFEGNRATSDGSSRIRVRTKSRGSKAKKDSRSKKRAAAYKAAGGKRSEIGK